MKEEFSWGSAFNQIQDRIKLLSKPSIRMSPALQTEIRWLVEHIQAAERKSRIAPQRMTDRDWLFMAFGEALRHPNARGRVGAILVKNGKIIGRGGANYALRSHAELSALQNAHTLNEPEKNKGVTLYVTYQPCDFRSSGLGWKSCSDYLIDSGIQSVVYAAVDPNVNHRGKSYLEEHGVTVRQIGDDHLRRLGQKVFMLKAARLSETEEPS